MSEKVVRILALDIGDARVGIAVSDPDERIATPVCVLATQEVTSVKDSFRRVIDEWEPELLLCGLPCTLAGDEGAQATHVRQMAEKIAEDVHIPLDFADERLSSIEAKRNLREQGYDERTMRGKIDMISACLFLQSWLDARAASQDER